MARIKETAKLVDTSASERVEDPPVLSEGEDLTQVVANPSELMGKKKLEPMLRFGRSLVSENLINFYVSKGYFSAGVELRKMKKFLFPKMMRPLFFVTCSLPVCDFLWIPPFLRFLIGSRPRCII